MSTTVYPMSGTNPDSNGDTSTGGGGTDYSDLLRRLAAYFGGASKANQTQNNLLDQRRQSQWKEVEDARLARDKFAEAAPGTRMTNSTRASLMNNWSPTVVHWGGPGSGKRGELPTYTGGLEGGMENLDPRSKQLNDTVIQQMLDRQTANKDSIISKPPPIGDESALDKLLGGAAGGTGLLDALAGGPSSGGNIADLIKSLLHREDRTSYTGKDPYGDNLPSYDEFGYYNDPSQSTGNPTDPSGGTGTGPGMQDFYNWLATQDQGGGSDGPTGTDWTDE